MDEKISLGETQPEQQTTIDRETPIIQPPSQFRAFDKRFSSFKSLPLFFAILALSMGMAMYILLAPAKETASNPVAYTAQSTPTPALIITPTTPITASSTAIMPTNSLSPTPTGSIEAWKTYTNAQYGYNIKYPSDWTLQDLGTLEPKVPSYVVFNLNTASASARSISVAVSTRTYTDQLAIEGPNGTLVTIAGLTGSQQNFKDSNGSQSTSIILPRKNDLIMLRSKTPFMSTFTMMLSTLKITTQ